jgi:hypothetical protein
MNFMIREDNYNASGYLHQEKNLSLKYNQIKVEEYW